MIETYVLIWMISAYSGYTPYSGSAYFYTLEACEKAKNKISNNTRGRAHPVLECFPTGSAKK